MKKDELSLQTGMQFDEAVELFSEETLNSMVMVHIVGGSSVTASDINLFCANCICFHRYCKEGKCEAPTTEEPVE